MKGTLIDILIVLAVPGILIAVFFYNQSSTETATVADDSLARDSKRIQGDLDTLSKLNFNQDVFQYMSQLKSFKYVATTIPPGKFEKRVNPFMAH